MPKPKPTDDEVHIAATFACVGLLPRAQRASYVVDIRVKYSAEPVVYILQALSHGMTDIFFGLLTSALYDRTKAKKTSLRLGELKRLIRQQRRELELLSDWVSKSRGKRGIVRIQRRYQVYEDIQNKIERADPSIDAAVEDAIHQLEKRGASKLRQRVDANFPRSQ